MAVLLEVTRMSPNGEVTLGRRGAREGAKMGYSPLCGLLVGKFFSPNLSTSAELNAIGKYIKIEKLIRISTFYINCRAILKMYSAAKIHKRGLWMASDSSPHPLSFIKV